VTRVQRIRGVPTFLCDGRPVLRPAFETYVPTRRYFDQFAGATITPRAVVHGVESGLQFFQRHKAELLE
jgi:hypothetical protein